MHRWSKGNPAPDAVGYMVALDRIMAGAPFSARKLADYCGWTRWHSTQVLGSVRAFLSEWHQPHQTAGYQPPTPSNAKGLQGQPGHNPANYQPETGHHAGGYTSTPTEQPQPEHTYAGARGADSLVGAPQAGGGPSPLASGPPIEKEGHPPKAKAKAVDLTGLWDAMEDIRLGAMPGSRRAQLGKRRDMLRARVAEHGETQLLHCWRWWWQSNDQRAQFLRDNGYGISTFLRAGKLRDYMDKATEWDPEAEASGGQWYTDADFDENGNLRAPQ